RSLALSLSLFPAFSPSEPLRFWNFQCGCIRLLWASRRGSGSNRCFWGRNLPSQVLPSRMNL
ncbi:hypothetical protein ACJX0J_018234, partial [Zea mays]